MKAKESKIPIKNIYFILSYAWKYFYLSKKKLLELDNYENNLEFFSQIFDSSLSRYLKRGLSKDYIEVNDQIKSIKGKINFNSSINKFSFINKKIYCVFDQYDSNTHINQLIKRTIFILLKSKIKKDLKLNLKKKLTYFNEVDDINIEKSKFKKLRVSNHDSHLKFLIKICQYIHFNISFNDSEGRYELSEFLENDQRQMGYIFENFILNFYKKKLSPKGYKVDGGEEIKWDSPLVNNYYPKMKTDITIKKNNKKVIIDAKYYGEIFTSYYNSKKFKSQNIYQIYAYMNNYKLLNENEELIGMLLYAANDEEVIRDRNILSGKELYINNLNLNKDWKKIEDELMNITNVLN